jgi:MFS transporter, DHA1 family, multidrug resistance protein
MIMAAVVLALGTVAFFRVALLPAIGDSLLLRPGLLSLLTVVFGVGRLLADLPAGHVADRMQPLRAFAAAGLALALGSLLLAGAHSLALLLVAAAVLGVASSVVNTTGMTYFSHAPVERRGKSLAMFSAALLGGQSLGPAVAGIASGSTGWRATEAGAGVAAALIGLACIVYRSALAPGISPQRPARAGAPAAAAVDSQRRLLYFVSFAVFFGLGAMPQTLLPLIGAHDYRLSAGIVGLLLGVGGLCRFVGAAVGGVVADRFSRKAALVPSLLIMGAGAVLLDLPGGPVVWIASVVLFSLGSFGVTVAATMLADLGGGVRVGRRLGTFRFAGDAGLVAGPLAAGWLYDTLGVGAASAGVGGLLAACAVVSAFVLVETRHAEAVPAPA